MAQDIESKETMTTNAEATHEMAQLLPELMKNLNNTNIHIADIKANQEKTSTILDHVWKDIKAHGERLTTVETGLASARTTKWSQVWQAAGVAIPLMGFVYFLIVGQIAGLETKFHEHDKLMGHPHSIVEKINAIKDKVDLQFNLLDGRLDDRRQQALRELDEVKVQNQKLSERLNEVEKRTGVLFKEGEPY